MHADDCTFVYTASTPELAFGRANKNFRGIINWFDGNGLFKGILFTKSLANHLLTDA